ncbi:MAG: GNAT family N-acetyltransferase [Kiloniellales bacterium]|nr:GNAT family N-acetyltransferase [Kiloniellales bacterium]
MPDGSDAIEVRVVARIAELPAAEWDACAGDNPFVSHAFLSALEESGSATGKTGWLPQHLAISGRDGRLIGAAPLYLKSHSYGEYVFDWGWADAYERAGGRYYPKLQACVPFTPVTGPRLLLHPACERPAVAAALTSAMLELARQTGISSLHVTFPTEAEWRQFGAAGFLQRTGLQYHWENRGYASFDDFLAALASRKRKAIKKERRAVAESGVNLRALTGPEIEPRHWDAVHRFYRATSDKKWGPSYLTRDFFHLLGERLGHRVVLIVAEHEGEPIGAALNLVGSEGEGGVLYGRNWGALGRFKFLHFEACYYQAIDYAIQNGLARVEAGAQGEHKIQRGYLPAPTYSAHWIRDPALRDAVAGFLARERRAIGEEQNILESFAPFRKDGKT